MSKQKTTRGKTSRSLPVFIADTSIATGGGLSGVTSASSGLVLEYRRQGQSTWTSVTPQAGKTLGSYLSGGIVADGSLAGAYEVDFPDAAFASSAGVEWVALRIRGVTNMLPVLIEIELDAVDYQDAAAFGLSRIDQTIGSRMATYTQPTGFLAATFPGTVASTTNITAATGIVLAGGGGGGTDWTANERTAIRAILGIPESGTTPTDPTTGILDEIRDSVGGSSTINVYPVSASTPERVAGTTITYYRNEIRSVSVVTDFTLTSLTLVFVIEDAEGTDLLSIPNASISRSDKTFTVSIGTAVTATISNYRWSLRDITGGTNSVIARGVFSVQEAAASA